MEKEEEKKERKNVLSLREKKEAPCQKMSKRKKR
jgi:hypothetical protein